MAPLERVSWGIGVRMYVFLPFFFNLFRDSRDLLQLVQPWWRLHWVLGALRQRPHEGSGGLGNELGLPLDGTHRSFHTVDG